MFEFLIELEANERKEYQKNPEAYKLGVETYSFYHGGVPDSPEQQVNYCMAYAIKLIVAGDKKTSASNPLHIRVLRTIV